VGRDRRTPSHQAASTVNSQGRSVHLLAAVLFALSPNDSTVVRQFSAILDASPIERLDSLAAATVVRGVIIVDLDDDGHDEAVVWIRPSLRQTPTILIFRRSAPDHWERLVEGLVPGRLQPVSRRLVDTHVHRVGADLVAGDGTPASTHSVLGAGASRGMSMVAYRGFLHADLRKTAPFVVDLSSWTLPKGTVDTCEPFEFSQPESLAFGTLDGGGAQRYLVALTEQDVTIYRVDSLAADGRLRMASWMRPRPAGTLGVARDPAGNVHLVRANGSAPVPAP
jgi:hypothetical protein